MRYLKKCIAYILIISIVMSLSIAGFAADYDSEGYYKISDGTYKNVMLEYPGVDEGGIYAIFWEKNESFSAVAKRDYIPMYAEVSYTSSGNKTVKIQLIVEEFMEGYTDEYMLIGSSMDLNYTHYEIGVLGNKISYYENGEPLEGKNPKIRFGETKYLHVSDSCKFYNGGSNKAKMTLDEVINCLADPYTSYTNATLVAKGGKITSFTFKDYMYPEGYVDMSLDSDRVPNKELYKEWTDSLDYSLTAPKTSSYLSELKEGTIKSKGGNGIYMMSGPATNTYKFSKIVKDGELVSVMAIQSGYALVKVHSSGRVGWVDKNFVNYDNESSSGNSANNASGGSPSLGISAIEIKDSDNYPDGVMVYDVYKGTDAENKGLKSADVITEIDGKKVKTIQEIMSVINKKKVGDTVTLKIWRDGKDISKKITLADKNGY